MSDIENQLDEICVLQSIYTEEEFSTNKDGEQNSGSFIAYINLPEGFYITYQSFKDNELVKVPILHLPPIILKFKLPLDYPSKNQPEFQLSCIWLNVKQLNLLCKRLDELWQENNTSVIIYIWTQFLKEESLEYLKIGESIDFTKRYLKELKRLRLRDIYNKQNCDIRLACGNDGSTDGSQKVANDAGLVQKADAAGGKVSGCATSRQQCYQHQRSNNMAYNKKYRTNTYFIDPRIVFQSITVMHTHQYLAAYNEDRSKMQFSKNIYLCEICFQDKLGAKCIEFNPCRHIYCRDCIQEYFQTRIKEGMVQIMPCPYDKCSSEANQSQIKEIIGPTLYERYDSLLLSATLNMMDDITYCPRQSCGIPVMREADDKMAVCSSCRFVFCVYCKMTYHGVEPCRLKTEEKRKIIEDYEKGDNETRFRLEKRYGKKQLQTLIQTHQSETWISTNSKPCPNCNANIEKSDGCNKMACWKCKQYFCWLCLKVLDPNAPYNHFMDPMSRCHNQLFHGVNLNEEQEDGLGGGVDDGDNDYLAPQADAFFDEFIDDFIQMLPQNFDRIDFADLLDRYYLLAVQQEQ